MRIRVETKDADKKSVQILWLILSMTPEERRRIGLVAEIHSVRQTICHDGVIFDEVPFVGSILVDGSLSITVSGNVYSSDPDQTVAEVIGARQIERLFA